MIANISGIFALGYFVFSPELCVFKGAIDCREGWNGSERKTEQKPSIKSVLSRAEFERLEVENFVAICISLKLCFFAEQKSRRGVLLSVEFVDFICLRPHETNSAFFRKILDVFR